VSWILNLLLDFDIEQILVILQDIQNTCQHGNIILTASVSTSIWGSETVFGEGLWTLAKVWFLIDYVSSTLVSCKPIFQEMMAILGSFAPTSRGKRTAGGWRPWDAQRRTAIWKSWSFVVGGRHWRGVEGQWGTDAAELRSHLEAVKWLASAHDSKSTYWQTPLSLTEESKSNSCGSQGNVNNGR